MGERSPAPDGVRQRVLVIGQGRLVDAARRALGDGGARVIQLREPADREIRRAMSTDVDAVMVISRDDRVSLRIALVVEGLRPGARLIVTIYNRDLAAQLRRAVQGVRVMSMADIVAAPLAAACLAGDLLSVRRFDDGPRSVARGAEGPMMAPLAVGRPGPLARVLGNLISLVHPFELSAKTLLSGLLGFALILLADTSVVILTLHESVTDALYAATKTIVTVGPSGVIDHGPDWLKLVSAAMMLAALAFTAVFTAGLIERLLDRRLVAILGARTMPRRGHVIVVGLGQVGLRLCMMLRALGIPVVAVESDPDADNIRRAKQYGVPVVIGRGNSRAVLARLELRHARSIAAVTSDEIENVSTAVAALALREDLPTVLRAGSGHMLDETRALFRIGAVRDVYRIGGTLLASAALGSSAEEAFADEETVWVIGGDGRIERSGEHLRAAARAPSSRAGVGD